MDLTTVEGLTEVQIKAITEAHNADVTGLKDKNTELLGKMDGLKTSANEQETAVEDARKTAIKAEEDKLIAEGKYTEALALGESERAKLIATANTERDNASNALKQRDVGDINNEILGNVQKDLIEPAKAMLSSMTSVTYDENGKVVKSIKCGEQEFSTTDKFLEFARTNPTWNAMLKAPDTQGLNLTNSNAKGDGFKSNKIEEAKKAKDLNGFLAESLKF